MEGKQKLLRETFKSHLLLKILISEKDPIPLISGVSSVVKCQTTVKERDFNTNSNSSR